MKENVIKLHDKKFKVMIPAAKIEEAVAAKYRILRCDQSGRAEICMGKM